MDYEKQSKLLKAIAHPTRLLIVDRLKKSEMCVCKINQLVDVDQSTISKHLLLLKKEGIIDSEKRGPFMYYRIANKKIIEILKVL